MLPIRRLGGWLFGAYRLNYVYRQKLPPPEEARATGRFDIRPILDPHSLEHDHDPRIRKLARPAGENAAGFAAYEDHKLASVCWVWTHQRFRDDRIWILSPSECILVELHTLQQYRGKGLAPALIQHAAVAMAERGMDAIYTWVWWSNRPSTRAFDKAGWQRIAFVAELYPLGARTSLVIRRCLAPHGDRGRSFEISWR